MPRYRARAKLFVDNRVVYPGEEFESDLPPGRNWERIYALPPEPAPLDPAPEPKPRPARGPLSKRYDLPRYEKNGKLIYPPKPKGPVRISKDWEHQSVKKRRGIAIALGAPRTVTIQEATDIIEAELARRAAAV